MASGTINFNQSSSSGKYIDGKIEWSSSQDIGANNSDVTAKLYVRKGDTTQTLTKPTEGSWSYNLTVNGQKVSSTVSLSVLESWVLVATKTVNNISHNDDGSKTISISGSVSAPSITLYNGHTTSGSSSVSLGTIPRASAISSAGDVNLGSACSVKWTPKATSFRYKLKFSLGSWSYTTDAIHPNKTSEYTYTGYKIPLSVANQMTTTTGSMQVTLYTYSNSGATTQVGSTSSKTFTVTIPSSAASAISSASNVTLGNACTVKWTPKVESFRYKLTFSIGSWRYTSGTIHPNKTTAHTYNYTIPIDVANQIPKASGTITVTLNTYVNSGATTKIGDDSETFTATVPETTATKPTVTMTLAPSSSLVSPYNSLYIQGYSKVKANLTTSTKYGATVAATNITVNGKTYASPYESDILSVSGKLSVKATVKDSRGYYGTYYKDIDVIPYSRPYAQAASGETNIVATRCDSNGSVSDDGTYLKIKAKVVYSNVASKNFGKIKYRYRKEGGAYNSWTTILDAKTAGKDEVTTGALLDGKLDTKSNYQVQILASDDFSEFISATIAIPSEAVYMDRPAGGKSMGLGGRSSGDGGLDVYWKTKARGGLSLYSGGQEIPLDTTLPIPRDQIKGTWDANNLENGVHVVANNNALKQGDTVIMYNGVVLQMNGDVAGNVKFQLALPVDENRSPMYRLNWYSNWSNWRSLKL